MSLPPSLFGGVGLALSAHTLLALNGRVFGISGFLHRAVKGAGEGMIAVAGLILGGFIVGKLEGVAPPTFNRDLGRLIASGFLVGLGTKLANGCTSGHMLCGIARLSVRSFAATLTFFATGATTARLLYGRPASVATAAVPAILARNDIVLLAGSALGLAVSWLVAWSFPTESKGAPKVAEGRRRDLVQFLVTTSFALSLRVSRLVDPNRVIGFLLLPTHPAFDPALLYLAAGAMPLLAALYRMGPMKIKTQGVIDAKLLVGAAIFGIGWGMEGICPGPGLVNFGQALATGIEIGTCGTWLAAVIAGGLIA